MLIISHRGAKGLAPENTAAAFKAGLQSRADMIEFDIRTSVDGELIIHHDPTIAGLEIAKTECHTLKEAKPDLLTFTEVLEIIDGKKPLVIDIKLGSDIDKVIPALRKAQLPVGSVFASFDLEMLMRIKKVHHKADLMVLHKWSGIIAARRARKLKTKRIAINHRWLWRGYIWAASKSGYQLTPYIINNPKRAKKWAKAGLYGLVTDFPDRF